MNTRLRTVPPNEFHSPICLTSVNIQTKRTINYTSKLIIGLLIADITTLAYVVKNYLNTKNS